MSNFADIFSLAKDIFVPPIAEILAEVVALAVGAWWLDSRRRKRELRELVDAENFKVAYTLIRKTRKLQNAIVKCWNPRFERREFPKNYELMSPDQKNLAKALQHDYENRFKHVWTALREFEEAKLDAESLSGCKIKGTEKILSCTQDLLFSVLQIDIRDKGCGRKIFEKSKSLGEKADNIVEYYEKRTVPFRGGTDVAGEFSKRVEKAVSEIEQYVRPYMLRCCQSKVKSMQKKILYFCSAVALAAAFMLSGCALLGITDADSGPAAPQFSATAQEVAEWRTAAESGDAWAQHQLSNAYYYGVGVAKDKRESIKWARKAAEQGDVGAQYNLALSYARGEGVAKNQRKAVNWFRKAAEQGSVDAQFILGAAYHDGRGVVADRREAYIWWSIAKAGDDEVAAKALAETNWRSTLSRSEIRSAQKEAARRMEAIERRKAGGTEKSAVAGGVASVPKPKGANIAERVFENTWRSVVVVHNGSGQGSGVIIRPNIVATNCHVVDGYGGITVHKSDNRRADTDSALSATIRESDEDKDFCLLDVDGLWGVPVAVRKYDTLGVGEDVYGLGAPQGLDLSLSGGVISQLREIRGNRVIQTDAAISPGSSGGGLFDSEGNLVGILTSKIVGTAAEGIGFAIPADLVLGY